MTILSGEYIFKLVDTYGLPMDMVNETLRERGLGFNVVEFVKCAILAGWGRRN